MLSILRHNDMNDNASLAAASYQTFNINDHVTFDRLLAAN